jgi:hypothetical protein
MYKEIEKCRISDSKNLISVLSLGEQHLSGVFPATKDEKISKGPLDLVWCPDSGLLQLKQSYSLEEMYGDNYGYRSGLNQSMVNHLTYKARYLEKLCGISPNDLIVDIGSNDATLLKAFTVNNIKRVGIDPSGKKFAKFYPEDIDLIDEFFPSAMFNKKYSNKKAKLITSISMFYDLEDPLQFVGDISNALDDNGVWHFEQSYMPSMLKTGSYDTICHEHLEYYSLAVVKNILSKFDLVIIDVQFNDINGGSFAVTAAKKISSLKRNSVVIDWLLMQEDRMGLDTPKPYREFEDRVYQHRKNLVDLICSLNENGKKIIGYGASTKGNILLQFCGLKEKEIPFIAEVNQDKFGCVTPGTNIPIISEQEARSMNPDYFLILPWHFKSGILEREKEFLSRGGKFIVPLPEIQII